MSADHGYALNQAALLAEAAKLDACEAFRVEAGGSRHHCADCGQVLAAHVAVALVAKLAENCGACRHYEAGGVALGVCMPDRDVHHFPLRWRTVPRAARCEQWAKAPDCRACEDTLTIEVTYNSDPTNSRTIICDQCEAGREAARAEAEREAAIDG